MARNMYQKRKEGQENRSNNESQEGFQKTVINWDMPTYRQPHSNLYGIRKIEK